MRICADLQPIVKQRDRLASATLARRLRTQGAPNLGTAHPMATYRHGATFVADWRPHSRVLDRNERAKILFLAESLERRTKQPGRHNGLLGYTALQLLRCLMFGFLNHRNGLCCPSYGTLQERTGLCRQSIAVGLARLERTGILKIVRRLVRQRVERVSPVTGEPEMYVGTTQTSSLYSLHRPGAWSDHLPVPRGRSAPFPCAQQLTLLERMVATWKVSPSLKQSLNSRLKPTPSFTQLANIIPERGE